MVFGWSGGSWGGFDVCSTLFMIPFVLVGLGTIAGTGYYTLALFNPKVELQFDSGSTRLGETLALKWRLIGRPGRLNDFKLTLEAIEEAKYRRGTDTVTDTNTFIEIPLAEFDHIDFTWRGEGEASVELPRDAMHSFVADNNKIIWRVRAKGAIPRWPDVNDSTDITVLPEGA